MYQILQTAHRWKKYQISKNENQQKLTILCLGYFFKTSSSSVSLEKNGVSCEV